MSFTNCTESRLVKLFFVANLHPSQQVCDDLSFEDDVEEEGRWKQKLAQPKEVLMKLNLARNPIKSVSFAKTRWDEKGLSINPSETFYCALCA